MWTEVAPVLMEKNGPRKHTLLSVTVDIMMKRRPSILQAQVRRMAVISSGLVELVKSLQRMGKTFLQTLATYSISTQ